MPANSFNIKGLTHEQVMEAREKYGYNRLEYKKENGVFDALKSLVKEPMVILLLMASSIYFISEMLEMVLILTQNSKSWHLFHHILTYILYHQNNK